METLRFGWDRHVQFGLDHPALYLLMYVDPDGSGSPAAELSAALLRSHMAHVPAAGSLRIPEQRAVEIFHAAAVGVVVTLLRSPTEPDLSLSATVRDHTLALIADTGAAAQSNLATAAASLQAIDAGNGNFTPAELLLFKEWLARLMVDQPA